MHLKSTVMLRVLLNYYHQNAFEPLLKYLPADEQQAVLAQKITSQDVKVALTPASDLVTMIHYSWLVEPIQQRSKEEQLFILSSLPEGIFPKLNRILALPLSAPYPLAQPVQSLFRSMLYKQLNCANILPPALFSPSKLNFLASWGKQELIELVDFLGIYDLANLVRQIIDKHKLKLIYACLSSSEKQFMRTCLHSKDKITLPQLELEPWQGDPKKLKELVHRRGLLRLGKALSNEAPDLIWTVSRLLDKGRGTILFQYGIQKATPAISSVLLQQIENSINFIKTKSSS